MGRPSPEGASVGYPLSGIPLSSEARGNGLHGRRCTMSDQPKWVIAPGGPWPPETAHHVSPGESVRYTSEGQPVVEREFWRAPSEDLVLTPGGFRQRSQAHRIESGVVLDAHGGRLRTLHASGHVLAEFGELRPRAGARPRSERRMLPSTRTCRPESASVSRQSRRG